MKPMIAVIALLTAGMAQAGTPPGFTLEGTGTVHDFDYFQGGWTTAQHKLKHRHSSDTEWEDFPSTLCMTPYLGGAATVDELYMPAKKSAGLTVRLFDPGKKQWAIYWVNSAIGKLDPTPMIGGFAGNRGEFYSLDEEDGHPIKVRFIWTLTDRDHARWEQAFSYDDKSWETNWTADFTRGDPAKLCDQGRPRR